MTYIDLGTDSRGSSEPGSTSSSLLEQVKTGQSEAWARLVDLYGPNCLSSAPAARIGSRRRG